MKQITKYNIFNFFTTFAKCLVEVFIPIILYNNGTDINNILLFFMFSFSLNIILSFIVTRVGERFSYKWVIFLSSFIFCGMYYYLQINDNLLILALLYSANTIFYYMGKHNYAASVIVKKSIGKGVGSFLIVTILATIPASYVGSLLIKYFNLWQSTLLVLVIYLIGVIPVFRIKYINHCHDSILKLVKQIPRKNFLYFALTQFKVLFFLFYPLYVFINVSSNYSFIGLLNAIVGIASIFFIWYYAKKMDQNKKDYMMFASIFLSIILFWEINIKSSLVLIFVSVLEGIATKLYETSNSRDFYLIDNKMDKSCYFLVSELLNNFVKLLLIFLVLIFNFNLYKTLFFFIIGILFSGFVKFKDPR